MACRLDWGEGDVGTCSVLRLKVRKKLREWPSPGESVRVNSLYAEGGWRGRIDLDKDVGRCGRVGGGL